MPVTAEFHDHSAAFLADLDTGAAREVRAAVQAIHDGAQDYSAVRSGAQQASIYIVTADSSTYDQAVADAREANEQVKVFAEVAPPASELEALVAVAVVYGQINEEERQAFVAPATEDERPRFVGRMEGL